jgi:hypothetical protein
MQPNKQVKKKTQTKFFVTKIREKKKTVVTQKYQ